MIHDISICCINKMNNETYTKLSNITIRELQTISTSDPNAIITRTIIIFLIVIYILGLCYCLHRCCKTFQPS